METLPSSTVTPDDDSPRPRPYLTLAFDCDRPLGEVSRYDLSEIDEVVIGRGDARSVTREIRGARRTLVVALADARASQSHARLQRNVHRWSALDLGSSNGTRVDGARITARVQLSSGSLVEIGHTFFAFHEHLVADAPSDVAIAPTDGGLVSLSPPFAAELARLERLAASMVSIVIDGETGTGKELVARAIHALSRRSGPLVAVNCAAIAASLVEAELFGNKKGAFSGASEDRPGLLRAANGGTIFFDEVAELAPSAQAALLRALQEKEVLPVGATAPLAVDVRVVAATHRDLDQLVVDGAFRADLLARLRGRTIALPPLRERAEDIGLLTGALVARHGGEHASTLRFGSRAARALLRFDWPLNVRQLEKAIEGAVAEARERLIDLAHLPAEMHAAADPEPAPPEKADLSPEDRARREELVALLEQHGYNVSAVARAMGKARMQIQRWMRRYGLEARR